MTAMCGPLRPCMHGRPCTAVYASCTWPCIRGLRPVHGRVCVRVHGQLVRGNTTAYTAIRVHGTTRPCTRARPTRRCTRPVHARVHGRVGRPLDCRPRRAFVYTAVIRPCTRHVHGRVHGPYAAVYTGRVHVHMCTHVHMYTCTHVHLYMYTYTYTCACTHVHVHIYTCTRVHVYGPCTHVHGPYTAVYMFVYTNI